MSKGDWHRHVAFVGLGAVVVGLVAGPIIGATLATGQEQWLERQKYEQQAQAGYRQAGHEFSLLSEVEQRASSEERERAREAREKSDLVAQWATADWTQFQFYIGIVSLLFTGSALFFAYRAWQAAKESARAAVTANDDNRRRFEAERRPWLHVELVVGGHLTWRKGSATAPFKLIVRNVGGSVAIDVRFEFDSTVTLVALDLDATERKVMAQGYTGQQSWPSAFTETVFHNGEEVFEEEATFLASEIDDYISRRKERLGDSDPNPTLLPHIYGSVEYRTPDMLPTDPSFKAGFLASYGRAEIPRSRHSVLQIRRGDGDIADNDLDINVFQRWAK